MMDWLQMSRDHLARCSDRLADARRSIGKHTGLAKASSIIVMYQRQDDLLRALDLVWQAQGQRNPAPPPGLSSFPCFRCDIAWVGSWSPMFDCPKCGAPNLPREVYDAA
jgi:hypothetical protein